MIQKTFRPNRNVRIILVATQSVQSKHLCIQPDLSQMLKRAAVKVAFDLNLPIFRTDPILEQKPGEPEEYPVFLQDPVHQNRASSLLLTKEFLFSFVFE